MTKRQKFAIATIVLVLGILAIRFPFLQWRFRVAILGIVSWLISVWALYDRDFSGVEWGTLTILPAAFCLGAALIFPLLPSGVDSLFVWQVSYDSGVILALGLKVVFLLMTATGYYAILLSENIYNVAAERSIQLLRAAHSVGFIMALITAVCLYIVLASFHLNSLANFLGTTLISWFLIMPTVWAVNLKEKIEKREVILTLFFGLIMGELAWVLSFWPIPSAVFALFLGAAFYILVGIAQYQLSERLFGTTVREFITIAVIIFLLIVFTTNWAG